MRAGHLVSVLELDPCWAHSEKNYPLTRSNPGLCPMTPPHPLGKAQ